MIDMFKLGVLLGLNNR